MGIQEANIILDNKYNTYYAGQTVSGRIEYVFNSPKKVRGIHATFKGEANTFWTENETEQESDGQSRDVNTAHTGSEQYFQINYYILGNKTDGEIEIPTGKHSYPFTCALPPTLPSSFEGQYGYVRYTIKITLDRPWKFDQETKIAFTVINTLDLNLNPSYKKPIRIQFEKTFCCFCCTSPPLIVDIQAPVSGYCPGQVIPIHIDIENKSNVQLQLIKLQLRKVVKYRATSNTATKSSTEVVVETNEGAAPPGITRHVNLNMAIPPIPPSNLVNCSLIDLDYDLRVECVVSGMHLNMSDSKYVTIGTIPLVGVEGQSQPTPPSPGQPAVLPLSPGQSLNGNQGTGEGGAGWEPPNVPSAPPYQALYPMLSEPVYREGASVARRVTDSGDSPHTAAVAFAPRYPTYANVQPPPLPQ